MLFDLDGVLYIGDTPVPGGADVIAWLEHEHIAYRFLTNTSSRPRMAVVNKLKGMGIPATTDQLLTPVVVARDMLRRHGIRRPALFVPEATAAELADLDPLPDGAETGAGAVVIGDLGQQWDFVTLNRAFRLLMAEDKPPLLALGTTRYWRAPDGLRLDAGAFVAALEYAAGHPAHVLGKPDAAFYSTAVAALGDDVDEAVMVGDDIRADIEGAQKAGLTGVLVRTGKFTPADLDGDITPDGLLDSIADLPSWWQAQAPSP